MNETMTDFVKLVLTPQDRQALEQIASYEDRSMSSTVRKLIRDEARRLNLPIVMAQTDITSGMSTAEL